MSWIQHIAYVKNKVAKGIGIMFKTRTYLDRRSLINLYNAYFYPYLRYCVESWGNASYEFFILQNNMYRIVYNFLGSKQSFFASLINNSSYTNHFYKIYPITFTHIQTNIYKKNCIHIYMFIYIYIYYILLLFIQGNIMIIYNIYIIRIRIVYFGIIRYAVYMYMGKNTFVLIHSWKPNYG